MARKSATEPIPLWEDRWHEPTVEQLLQPYEPPTRQILETILNRVGEMEGVRRRVVWYGTAWKWTIELALHDSRGEELDKLVYLVLNPAGHLVSVPLRESFLQTLPRKRLTKYIREALSSAKCAWSLYWATWRPSGPNEVEHLLDLIKRKHNHLMHEKPAGG